MSSKIVGEKSAPRMSGHFDLFMIPKIEPHRFTMGRRDARRAKIQLESYGYAVWLEEITQEKHDIRWKPDLRTEAKRISNNTYADLIQICRDLNKYEELSGEDGKFTEEKEQLRLIRKSIENKLLG